MPVHFGEPPAAPVNVPVAIVGAGACGLVAALAARDAGADPVVVLERDAAPAGSTALSSGFIPAAGTRYQRAAGIDDTPARMAADILAKNHGEADHAIVERVACDAGRVLEWLDEAHGVGFHVLEGFLYPGHSAPRMHAVGERTGRALVERLQQACAAAGVDLLCDARVEDLYADAGGRVRALGFRRPDGTRDSLGCDALVLACCGFGANRAMVAHHLPEVSAAQYFGHPGNMGDAIAWGSALGAAIADMGAYQGHGSVAVPHGILITWALMMEGGIQVNAHGERFSNEHLGYSEQCLPVLAQPGGVVWNVYDARLHRLGLEFPDYRDAEAAGALRRADDIAGLAASTGLPEGRLAATLAEAAALAAGQGTDRFGRDFTGKPALEAPYYAIRVGAALFHTQGGLVTDGDARVLRADGTPLPNLWAGGGAARGVSGAHVWGYLSGNGLLTAVVFGRNAGAAAAGLAAAGNDAARDRSKG